MKTNRSSWVALALVTGVAAACAGDPTDGIEPDTQLLSVVPVGGATDVDPNEPIVVTFDNAIHEEMVGYAALHEGDVTGPVVPGTWTLRTDGTELVFTPAEPLKPATLYTIHLGGGMHDAHGSAIDFETHGPAMGGSWADGGMMMGGGMMGGGDHPHMGSGWQHSNGTYGMVFSFTTAG